MVACPEDALTKLFLEIGNDLDNDNLIFPTCLMLNFKIRQTLENPKRNNRDLMVLIHTEPLITGRILRMANSVYFNRRNRQVRSLMHAIALIGESSIRTIAHITALQQFSKDTRSKHLRRMANELWLSTTDVGYWAYTLSERLRISKPDKALAAAIMMSTSIYLIINYLDRYPKISENPDCLRRLVLEMSPVVNRKILQMFRMEDCIELSLTDFDIGNLLPIDSLAKVIVLARLYSQYKDPFIEDLLIRKRAELELRIGPASKSDLDIIHEQCRIKQNAMFKIIFQY